MTKESIQPEINENDRLLRRVQFLHPSFIKPNGTPSSASFSLKKGEAGLSVDIERLTTYKQSILDKSRFRLFALKASYTLELGLKNTPAPLPDNPAHGLIQGNISRPIARKLASNAVRIFYPD